MLIDVEGREAICEGGPTINTDGHGPPTAGQGARCGLDPSVILRGEDLLLMGE